MNEAMVIFEPRPYALLLFKTRTGKRYAQVHVWEDVLGIGEPPWLVACSRRSRYFAGDDRDGMRAWCIAYTAAHPGCRTSAPAAHLSSEPLLMETSAASTTAEPSPASVPPVSGSMSVRVVA